MKPPAPPPPRCSVCGYEAGYDKVGRIRLHTNPRARDNQHFGSDVCPGSSRMPLLPGMVPLANRR